jgi:hypothetical protein
MVTMIGTELSLATLVEDFLHQQVEASDVCRRAASWLADPLARDVVVAFAGIHDRDLSQLRKLAGACGAHPPERGTDHEAQTLGQLELAHARDGDAAVLAAVARVEDAVIEAYERVLANTALPESLAPLFANALDELRRRRERLTAALRLAA